MARASGAEQRAVESRVVRRRWRELVAAWKRSGQDERLFCERQKIGVCALRWWVRRLAGDDVRRSTGRAGQVGTSADIVEAAPSARRRGHSRQQWARFCAEWERSGLRQAEFCGQRGLNVETLRWWRSQLRVHPARDVRAHSSAAVTVRPAVTPVPAFVPVTVMPAEVRTAASRAHGPTIDVVLRGHRRVRVGPDFDERLLARVVLVLEATP
jgi:hypothetical protein